MTFKKILTAQPFYFIPVIAITLLFSACFSFAYAQPANATFEGQNGNLLFKKSDNKYYFSDPEGQNESLTPWNHLSVEKPTFSPNGTRIAFKGSNAPQDYSSNISHMNLDGSGLSYFGYKTNSPSWSPDGLSLFYSTCSPATVCYLHKSNLDWGQTKSYGSVRYSPTISPDGQTASETSIWQDPSTIETLSLTQANATLSTRYSEAQYDSLACTSWSPDSQKIASWSKTATNSEKTLKIINASTGSIDASYSFTGFPSCPVWSPDSTKIIFGANKNITPNLGQTPAPVPDYAMIQISLPAGTETRVMDDVTEVNDWQAITDQSTSSVYRFWSDAKSHHFYTSNYDEAISVIQNYNDNVWKYEATAFKVSPVASGECASGKSPVYRFWSHQYQGHFYTISSAEKDEVIAKWPSIWSFEGVAFCASTSPSGSFTSPVYRFWSDKYQGHFYTTSSAERDNIIQTWPVDVWKYEGTAYYVAS